MKNKKQEDNKVKVMKLIYGANLCCNKPKQHTRLGGTTITGGSSGAFFAGLVLGSIIGSVK